MTTTTSNVDLSAANILYTMKNTGGISLETIPFFSSLIAEAEAATDDRDKKVRVVKWLQGETDKRFVKLLRFMQLSEETMISSRKQLERYIVVIAQTILKELRRENRENRARRMASAATTTSAGATTPPPPAPVKRKHMEQPEKDEDEEDDSDLFTSEETRDISRRRF